MQHNNRNKIFDDIGSLKTTGAENVFDAENVWNKLEKRITKKKKRNVVWIWFAASTLLLLSVSMFFKQYNFKNNIVIGNEVQQQNVFVKKPSLTNNTTHFAGNNIKKRKIKTLPKTPIVFVDTASTIVKIQEPIFSDSTIASKKENKNIAIQKQAKKRLKVVYASDFEEENNNLTKYKQQEKNTTTKTIFKIFEPTSINNIEEGSTNESNQQQPNKTFLFFKTKTTSTISINENQ